MTKPEIESFLAVVRYGSITQAAENLMLAPSTISQRLQALESELNVSLIKRNRGLRNCSPTTEGYTFIPLAHRWLHLWEESQITFSQESPAPMVIASSKSIHKYILSDICKQFSVYSLPLKISLTTPTFQDVYQTLQSGETNLALFSNIRHLPHVTVVPIFNEQMVFLCSHGSSYPPQIHPANLSIDHELYVGWNAHTSWGDAFSSWHNYWFPNEQFPYIMIDNVENISFFFSKNIPDIWCIVPISVATPLIASGIAESRELLSRPLDRTTYLLTMHDNLQSHYCRFLLDNIHTALSEREGFQLFI